MNGSEGWTEDESQEFINYGPYFVPERERQAKVIASLVPATASWVLDLCCGDGYLIDVIKSYRQDLHFFALDNSSMMLEAAKLRLARYGDEVQFVHSDLRWLNWAQFRPTPSFIFSSLAIHHLQDDEKRDLYRAVAGAVGPAGVFVMADLLKPESESARVQWGREWEDEVAENSQQHFGDDRALSRFRELEWNHYTDPNPDDFDQPSALIEHLDWLREAGFSKIDIQYFRAGHAIISACCE